MAAKPPNFDRLTNARIHATIAPAVDHLLLAKGFERTGDLTWVRDRFAPIRQRTETASKLRTLVAKAGAEATP
jgi:hypothetical protein